MESQVLNRHKNCKHVLSLESYFLILLCCIVISKDLFENWPVWGPNVLRRAATDMPRNARNNENGKFGENSRSFGENCVKEISKGAP